MRDEARRDNLVEVFSFDGAMPTARDAIALGHPGVLCAWVFDMLRDVCAMAPERATIRAMDREDTIDTNPDRGAVVYLTQFPGSAFRAEWAKGDTPILLCLDDPVDSVRFLKQIGQGSTLDALRMETAAAAAFPALRSHPLLMILHRFTEAPAAAIVDAILDHLKLPLPMEQREALHRKYIGPAEGDASLEAALRFSVPDHAPLGEPQTLLDAKEIAIVGDVLSPLLPMSFRDSPGPVVWPIEAFFSGDRPNSPAALVTDLTGAARILYYGPYFYLPAGVWKVRMMVGFSAGARSMPFSVEVYAGEQPLAVATLVPEDKGVYQATFNFRHDLVETPVEVRFRTDRGAIEGRVALGRVEFSREPASVFAQATAG